MNIAIIGGGVIGLSTAWELASRGHEVTLIDRGPLGRKASWAGAGILLPGNADTAIHPIEQLEASSNRLHESWARRLREATGIDNGYRKCGGIYVAMSAGEIATLAGSFGFWQDRQIEAEKLSRTQFAKRFPNLEHLTRSTSFLSAWLPDEAQICNPWHIKALVLACQQAGVRMLPGHEVTEFCCSNGSGSNATLLSIGVASQSLCCDALLFACGAWTQQATSSLADSVPMVPVRGQMILYRLDEPLGSPIVNEGTRYVVPREDGHVLVGATIEEAGFDESTTALAIEKLQADAERLVPALTPDRIVKSWAGLRPGTHDGFPYMGRLPDLDNVFVSTGHFKTGLQLSPGSALAMADLIEGKPTQIDLAPFDPARVLIEGLDQIQA